MICSLDELKSKEVIDVKTGERLGYIDDIRINTDTSAVLSLLIYGGYRFFGLFGRESDTEKLENLMGREIFAKIPKNYLNSILKKTAKYGIILKQFAHGYFYGPVH